ncbi:hypothetical protein AAFF_G00041520 [Aldrovandia affinis]|uniref:Uncharacterized protein n=1 Tax=Aldrovandia affinis TaxID=143900 RepID=A0AAD7WF68_9TELE|nr:hypothetical protein AAFF_G00041520 [Aldrovandia affinis]
MKPSDRACPYSIVAYRYRGLRAVLQLYVGAPRRCFPTRPVQVCLGQATTVSRTPPHVRSRILVYARVIHAGL